MNITDKITITNECNMSLMSRYPDNYFDLAIVDPPYGINAEQGTNRKSRKQFQDKEYGWDNSAPEESYFIELRRVSKNQIIWGANHFIESIPFANSKHWLIWDKKNPDRCFADAEMAWGSQFDNVRIMNLKRVQELNKDDFGKIHPTQKPTQLYRWILERYTKQDSKVLDTHLGSGSIAISCHDYGVNLTACELDTDYYNAAIKRIKNHISQTKLF